MKIGYIKTWMGAGLAVMCGAWVLTATAGTPAAGALKNGDIVAVTGDSITEQKLYSLFIEEYLLMCQPVDISNVCQFGWSGERAPGLASRMGNDVLWLKPTVATTCYGMNDGGYRALEASTATNYLNAMTSVVEQFKKAGTRLIIVGSPGVVDSDTYKRAPDAAIYNQTLAGLRDVARQLAADQGVAFADVHSAMQEAMVKAKAKYGPSYAVAGNDGVHPGRNGHLVMAYAFLKAMGCDGSIGNITVDLKSGKADASSGHTILASKDGVVEIESKRYPFCFSGDPSSPDSTSGIIEFVPFNQDLNRLTLTVTGATGTMNVTWGSSAKTFTAEQLACGINLAAEFLDNPFIPTFRKVELELTLKQTYETLLHKSVLHMLAPLKQICPEESAALDRIAVKSEQKQWEKAAAVRTMITPVKHTLKIEPAPAPGT